MNEKKLVAKDIVPDDEVWVSLKTCDRLTKSDKIAHVIDGDLNEIVDEMESKCWPIGGYIVPEEDLFYNWCQKLRKIV